MCRSKVILFDNWLTAHTCSSQSTWPLKSSVDITWHERWNCHAYWTVFGFYNVAKWEYSHLRVCFPRNNNNNTTTVLRPFVRDYPSEPVPEETLTQPPSWSSSSLYQLPPSTTIHSILLVQITCLAIFLHNLFPCPLWSTSWSEAIHLIFHTFLHPISVFFSQHMPIPSQPVLL